MRSMVTLLVLSFLSLSLSGCGESKPDPRDRPDFIDTSDPAANSLYSPEDFENKGKPQKRP